MGGFYLDLESANRGQLSLLADQLNIRIAIPVAKDIKRGFRDWRAGKSTRATYLDFEAQAKAICGEALAVPRALIGFSEGGYFARDIAFTCRALTANDYGVLLISGAKPAVPARDLLQCNDLVIASGDRDGSTDVGGVKFVVMAGRMKARYPNMDIRVYPGRHVLPPNELLGEYLSALP